MRKVFVEIKILFRISIRIRIMILLWISIPDLRFIHTTKLCLDPLTPSKVIVSTSKVHVHTDGQTDRRTFFLLVLSSKTYKTWTFVKRREFFFFTHAIRILSLFTYSICDEKVKRILLPHRFHKVVSLRKYVTWFWLPQRRSFVDTSNFASSLRKLCFRKKKFEILVSEYS